MPSGSCPTSRRARQLAVGHVVLTAEQRLERERARDRLKKAALRAEMPENLRFALWIRYLLGLGPYAD